MTFIFLSGIYSIKAQTVDTGIADSFFSSGQYDRAAIEYEKVFFRSDNPPDRAMARLKRVQCLKQVGRYQEALTDLGEIPLEGLNPGMQQEIRYQSVINSYLSADYTTANSCLEQYHYFSGNQKVPDQVYLLEILNHNQLFEYDQAFQKASEWVKSQSISDQVKDSLLNHLQHFYNPKHQPKIRKEKTARLFSSLVPGSGQVYDGFTGEGVINFLLCATTLGVGIYAFIEGYYLSGYIIGAGLLQKLYFGGIRRAGILSYKANYLRTKEYNDQARVLMLSIYSLGNEKF